MNRKIIILSVSLSHVISTYHCMHINVNIAYVRKSKSHYRQNSQIDDQLKRKRELARSIKYGTFINKALLLIKPSAYIFSITVTGLRIPTHN